jgi:hypothetical protein
MKTTILIVVSVLTLAALPANAAVVVHPHVRLGFGFGAPYYPYGWYDPWFYGPPYWDRYAPPPPRGKDDENAPESLFVYPTNGQSEAQTAEDRQACNAWAVTQSGLDPATAKKRAKAQHLDEYDRAFTACMEGRNYKVD